MIESRRVRDPIIAQNLNLGQLWRFRVYGLGFLMAL